MQSLEVHKAFHALHALRSSVSLLQLPDEVVAGVHLLLLEIDDGLVEQVVGTVDDGFSGIVDPFLRIHAFHCIVDKGIQDVGIGHTFLQTEQCHFVGYIGGDTRLILVVVALDNLLIGYLRDGIDVCRVLHDGVEVEEVTLRELRQRQSALLSCLALLVIELSTL